MNLLEFARGPAFNFALIVFVFGVVWRLAGLFLQWRRRDLSKPRQHNLIVAGTRAMLMRSLPPHELEKHIVFQHMSGYAWHICWFISLLFFAPHLPFFKQFLGFAWPALPNWISLGAGGVALALLLSLVIRRATNPVLKQISTWDDYISVVLTILPLATGFLAYGRLLPIRYETLLALHLLSICTLLIWYPFGKLMHLFLTFPSRFQAGALLGRKGVEA
ncbi:MAG: nitrate reductase [Pseudomonadota bacterium]